MAKRVAFFASKEDVEAIFNLNTKKEAIFEPQYNIAPGHQLPAIVPGKERGLYEIKRMRWGHLNNEKTVLSSNDEAVFEGKGLQRCVLPLSGFYVWKDDKEKEQPFFVRMLNNPVMPVAGLIETDGNEDFVCIVTMKSNPLIHPMSDEMPLLLDKTTAIKWVDPKADPKNVLESAENLYLLTDLSVLRVSKKVNDPANNDPRLIQPIPK